VEEGAVLVVLEAIVEFVFPDDAAGALEIDDLEVESCLGEVADESDGAFYASVAPLGWGWMGSIDAAYGCGDDLVVGGRDGGLDLGLVRGGDCGGGRHGLRMAVVLFAGPARDDEIGGEGDEERCKEDAAVGGAEVDGSRQWCGGGSRRSRHADGDESEQKKRYTGGEDQAGCVEACGGVGRRGFVG
jgi:hypothetical protein